MKIPPGPYPKTLRVFQILEGEGWSGGQQQALFLALGLKEMGHSCQLLCSPRSELFHRAMEGGVSPLALEIKGEADLKAYQKLLSYLRRFQPHLINAHRSFSYTLMLLAAYRFPNLRAVLSRRVLHPPKKNPLSRIKYFSRRLNGYIAVSQAVKELLIQGGVSPQKIKVIPSGTDTRFFHPMSSKINRDFRQSLSIEPEKKIVTLVANKSPYKGQEEFLKIIAQLKNYWTHFHFLMVGRDTDQPDFVQSLKNRFPGAPLSLLGFRKDIPSLLNISRVSLNLSSSEACAGTIRESLACGVPVIASKIGGNPELITDCKEGFLVPEGDIATFAEKIIQIGCDDPLYQSLCKNSLKKAQNQFSHQAMVKKTIDFYRKIL